MIRWVLKWVIRLALAAAALVVVLLLCRNSILRTVTEHRIRAQTGLEVRIGKYSSDLFSPVVTVEDLRIYNTAEFGGTPFVNIREIHFELDPEALALHRLHFTLIRFNLAELDIVRNEAGQTNLFSLANKVRNHAPKGGESEIGRMLGDFEFEGVDVLNVSVGKARFVDLKNAANNCESNFGLDNQVFKNIRTRDELNGVLFLLYLRSGGRLCFVTEQTFKDFVGQKWPGPKPGRHPAPTAADPPQPRR
jgi:hypothetical protein